MAVDTRKNIRSLEADIRARWGQSLIMPARTLIHDAYSDAAKDTAASSEKAKKAVELAREARSVSPTSREAAEQIIKMGEKLLNSNNYVEKSTLETLDPDNASRKEQIAVYLREAAIFYKSKQYAKARDVLERVLILDPYNEKAVYDLKKVYQRLYRIAELRRENDILDTGVNPSGSGTIRSFRAATSSSMNADLRKPFMRARRRCTRNSSPSSFRVLNSPIRALPQS